jgi:hypothetical protein
MNKKYIVRLSSAEREQLEEFVRKGKVAAYKILHANILLNVDAEGPSWNDEQAAVAFHCNPNTVRNVRQRWVEEGLESALNRKKQATPSRKPLLDGAGQARLIALSCSPPPPSSSRWTLKLLGDKLVELKIVKSISQDTVRRVLKKTN